MNKQIQKNRINKLLARGTEIFQNPMVLFDNTYNLVAYTQNEKDDDYLFNELIRLRRFSHETVEFFKRANFVQLTADRDVALLRHESCKYDRMNGRIYAKDGFPIGNVTIVASHRPFSEQDKVNCEQFCDFLGAQLTASDFSKTAERVRAESFITKLLEGSISQEELDRAIEKKRKPNIFVLAIDISFADKTMTHLMYFREKFMEIQPELNYYIYLDNIVGIFYSDSPILKVKRDLKKLFNFCQKYNIYAGVSDGFCNILDTKKHYRHALSALNHGIAQGSLQKIFKHDDFRLHNFLVQAMQNTDISCLCNPLADRIMLYDTQHGTDYNSIFSSYLLLGRDLHKCALALNMDTKQITTALKEISTLFDFDFKDGNQIFSLVLTYRVKKILES